MKGFFKYILIFLFCFIYILSNEYSVNATNDEYVIFKKGNMYEVKNEVDNGDIIAFEINIERLKYRISKNSTTYLDVDFSNNQIAFINFIESTSYYFYYGAIYTDFDNDIMKPFIIRADKNLLYIDYYYDSEVLSAQAHYYSALEYGCDELILSEFYDGYFDMYYVGKYRMVHINNKLEMEKCIDCGENEVTISNFFGLIDIRTNLSKHTYFDSDFNIVEDPLSDEYYTNHFELTTSLYVNDEYYKTGTIFSTPGIYIIRDLDGNQKMIYLEAEITLSGECVNNLYDSSVDFKVSGGTVYLDDEIGYLNGRCRGEGKHTIKVLGLNGYTKEVSFVIKPELYSTFDDKTSVSLGERIYFSGVAKLNGETIKNGYLINDPGLYTIELYAEDNILVETHTFTVNQTSVKDSNVKWIYVVLVSLIIIVFIAIIIVFINDKKKKNAI